VTTTNNEWIRYIWWLAGILGVTLVVLIFTNQRKQFKARELEKAKQAAAVRIAQTPVEIIDPLKECRDYLFAGDHGKFYSSVNRAMWKAISEKMKLPASELNKLNIASGLRDKGWDDENIIQLKNVLNECEMKLYTPEFSTVDMQRVLASADVIISKLKT
jgi:hypothetical protein